MKLARIWMMTTMVLAAACYAGTADALTGCPNTRIGQPGPYKIEFAVSSTAIDAANAKTLDEVAGFIKSRYMRACLLGRADKQGNQKSNYDLSVRRAQAVAAALRKRGVNAKNITVLGIGEAYGDWLNILNQSQADRAVDITLTK